jgi:hypothetical protein
LSLDVRIMKVLDAYATQDLTPEKKDELALDYLNNIDFPKDKFGEKTQYVKYYFQAKRDYNSKEIVKRLNLFDHDI